MQHKMCVGDDKPFLNECMKRDTKRKRAKPATVTCTAKRKLQDLEKEIIDNTDFEDDVMTLQCLRCQPFHCH